MKKAVSAFGRHSFSDCQKSPQDEKAHLREKVSEKL